MEESHIIALKDVETSNKQLHLRSINLKVAARESIAIIGRSGSGKTALLRCIALLERPLTGIVAIDNKNQTFLANRELVRERRNIGLITVQAEFLNSKNVFKNVALPLQIQKHSKEEINKTVEQVLTKLGLEHKAFSYPERLNPLQKVLLDLARNIVSGPKILLIEDVFSHLDQKSSDSLVSLLQTLKEDLKLTVLVVTNDANIIKTLCDSVIVMQQGTIAERCSVYDLFTKPNSEVAKDFIRFNTRHELPITFRKKISSQGGEHQHALVRINFSDCLAPEEILSNTIEAYDLKMNIIQAYQEKIQGQILNIMLIEVYGDHTIIKEAVNFLNKNDLKSEIVGYVPDIN